MSPTSPRLSIDDEKVRIHQDSFDLEANPQSGNGHTTTPVSKSEPHPFFTQISIFSAFQKLVSYPPPNSLKLKPTSWLDGVRGVAALGVYIFHAMGCWANIVAAWHADPNQAHFFQLPVVRTVFVSGGAAVSLFFALSGYVLTHSSLKRMRSGARDQIYPAVASSMFRRGFRLYLPPILLTFCEMLATGFGFTPPLNFTFRFESSLWAQFLDWVAETNKFINPIHNAGKALQGFVVHPKYDPVIWTIPLEFYGSFVCYGMLLAVARIPSNGARMGVVGGLGGCCMLLGSWNLFCFLSGMLIADFNLSQESTASALSPSTPSQPHYGKQWTTLFVLAFYAAGFPTLGTEAPRTQPMPGFETLHSFTPTSLHMEDHARFWWSLSGISLLLSISQLPCLKSFFNSNFCQYLGKISFSLYLVHEFCIVLFGLSLQRLVMGVVGLEKERDQGYLMYWLVYGIWFAVFSVMTFAVAGCVERWVDGPSVRFARWLEGKCGKVLRRRS